MDNLSHTTGFEALLTAASEVEASLSPAGSETPLLLPPGGPASTSQTPDLREMLQVMSQTFTSQLAAITNQVTSLSERVDHAKRAPRAQENTRPAPTPTPNPSKGGTPASLHPRLWCDRLLDEPLPTGPIVWPDEEEDADAGDEADGCQLHRVSAATEALLTEAFSKPTANATRRRWCKTFGMPATEVTKCPRLDNTLLAKSEYC